jgi:hypothetical protein
LFRIAIHIVSWGVCRAFINGSAREVGEVPALLIDGSCVNDCEGLANVGSELVSGELLDNISDMSDDG